ncbi:hypothetical protein [Lyngbya sp. CCY1209]|uniref:hypothetical protein n=1 Tax=Lyngbya sp. CCY1209 TaxID=2886103 RepID=UPI002D200447|nr:hypothetical protein [Lyngbya sp. CCY1209]MEB3884093.1 hypothetical protein [Lyngbya sp. CCY1209]
MFSASRPVLPAPAGLAVGFAGRSRHLIRAIRHECAIAHFDLPSRSHLDCLHRFSYLFPKQFSFFRTA